MDELTPSDPWPRVRLLPMGTTVAIDAADGRRWHGTLVPSHEFSGDRIVQLKLESGYNVGVRVQPGDRLTVVEPRLAPNVTAVTGATSPGPKLEMRDRPWVALLTTGGTIASRVDYRTGGVRPVKDEAEILAFYPDLEREGPVRVLPVFDRLSEDMSPADWLTLAERVAAAFADGAQGVVIAHGTDTLAFTGAGLSFLLQNLPGPVVLVGAQRSPDRPSSDGPSNLEAAVRVARHPTLAEVVVLMHATLSDDRFAIHRATRVRKMHSSRRDAFRSRNGPPLGYVVGEKVELAVPFRTRGPASLSVDRLDPSAGILWSFPGLDPARSARSTEGLRGLVLAGTGLGHVSSANLPWIRDAVGRGVVVVMTTQCLEGSVDPYVYATGRELLRAGVLFLDDLLPETAYAKLLWALGRSESPDEVRRLMGEDRVGEFTPRHLPGADE